eukprot:6183032-Pleurochrysis_carterae.AAC.3
MVWLRILWSKTVAAVSLLRSRDAGRDTAPDVPTGALPMTLKSLRQENPPAGGSALWDNGAIGAITQQKSAGSNRRRRCWRITCGPDRASARPGLRSDEKSDVGIGGVAQADGGG